MVRWTQKDLDFGRSVEFEHAVTIEKYLPKSRLKNSYEWVSRIAEDIAKDHLRENPKYYQKLKKALL